MLSTISSSIYLSKQEEKANDTNIESCFYWHLTETNIHKLIHRHLVELIANSSILHFTSTAGISLAFYH